MLEQIDLLALNIDEAAAVAGCRAEGIRRMHRAVRVERAARTSGRNAGLDHRRGRRKLVVGRSEIRHLPVHSVEVASTAGAGDAHLSGIIAGLSAGLSFADAHALGSLVAAMSVTSPHTINPEINRASLGQFAAKIDASLPSSVTVFLES